VYAVPLRGCGFEIQFVCPQQLVFSTFPSPCGDVVLKWYEVHLTPALAEIEFPSPCGDVVLKFMATKMDSTISRGFRPLAGMWF